VTMITFEVIINAILIEFLSPIGILSAPETLVAHGR
jgi:hypothetical protein